MDLWSWLSANGAVVEALATVVAAAIAATALGSAALDSRKRTRAIVVAELEPAEHNDSAGILVVRNVGPTPARDLCVQFDPPLDPSDEHEIYRALIDRYSQPIDTLGPQQRLCNVWWSTRPHRRIRLSESIAIPRPTKSQ